MAKRGSGKGGRGGRKGRSTGTGGGSHGRDASDLGPAAPVDQAGSRRAERGGGKRRSADDRDARRSAGGKRAGLDRASAELRRIERGLVEAQVILAEVAARADALEERLRLMTGHSLPGGAPQNSGDAESAISSETSAVPTPGPGTGVTPASPAAPVPGETAVPGGAPPREALPAFGATPVSDAGPQEAAPAPDEPTARWRGLSF